jgi:hypothetical protein
LFQGDIPDGTHKYAEDCETNPTCIEAKKEKHLEDSETTPKSCLDAVFKLLEASSEKSHPESVRLLQSQLQAERHTSSQLLLEVQYLRNIAKNTSENLIAKQLDLEHMTDLLCRSHHLDQLLVPQLPSKANVS